MNAPRVSTAPAGRGAAGTAGAALLGLGMVLLALSVGAFANHLHNNRYLLRATDFIYAAPASEEARAKALVHFVAISGSQSVDPDSASLAARLEHTLPFELSPASVLRDGFAFPDAKRLGPCGQLVRTVRAIAWLRHIPSHKVLMGSGATEHAMVALYCDGAYRLFDPTYDFYWTDRAGRVATVEQVRSDTAIFAQVRRRYPAYSYSLADASYLRWSRLGRPGVWIKTALTAVMGRRWVAGLDTPKLYDRPWWGYAWVGLTAALSCLVPGLALVVRERRKRYSVAGRRGEP